MAEGRKGEKGGKGGSKRKRQARRSAFYRVAQRMATGRQRQVKSISTCLIISIEVVRATVRMR